MEQCAQALSIGLRVFSCCGSLQCHEALHLPLAVVHTTHNVCIAFDAALYWHTSMNWSLGGLQ